MHLAMSLKRHIIQYTIVTLHPKKVNTKDTLPLLVLFLKRRPLILISSDKDFEN